MKAVFVHDYDDNEDDDDDDDDDDEEEDDDYDDDDDDDDDDDALKSPQPLTSLAPTPSPKVWFFQGYPPSPPKTGTRRDTMWMNETKVDKELEKKGMTTKKLFKFSPT